MSRANPRFRRPNNPLPLAIFNAYQANVLYTKNSQQFITTLYYLDNQPTGTNIGTTSLAGAVSAALNTFQPVLATDCIVQGVIVRNLNNPTVPSVTQLLSPTLAGTVAGVSAGTIQAVTIDRLTGIRGQAGRGHVNLGPVPDSWLSADGTSIIAPGPATYATWATQWLRTVLVAGGSNFTPILWSRGLRTQMPKLTGATPITGTLVRTLLGTVRRRKIGRGK